MRHHYFNADFYITAAALIPLLYIALTLQKTTFRNILIATVASVEKASQTADEFPGPTATKAVFRFTLLSITMGMIWYGGIIGEGLAVWALYRQSESTFSDVFVLASILALLLILAAATIWIPEMDYQASFKQLCRMLKKVLRMPFTPANHRAQDIE